jgi:hypothetical protein
MSAGSHTLGARLAAASPADRFALHTTDGEREAFADYDRVLARLFDHAIRGEQILDLTPATRRTESDVVTLKIRDDERAVLARVLTPKEQQARGGWYVPKADKPLVGVVEFARWARTEPRFSISAADAQRGAVRLDTPDAIVVWAALEPVMELLYLPLKLRSGYWLGDRHSDLMQKDWGTVDATYAAVGIDAAPLAMFKDGRAWAILSIEDVIAARRALLAAWHAAPDDVGERAIVLLISRLVERYYAMAKNGMAQRTNVMNKRLERALSGAFGGDWLALLRYLGEQVHPAERIATAVEPTSLLVSGRGSAAQAAATTGVPVEEIERILAAYWGGHDDSPVEQRAQMMRDWWRAFDELHARQTSRMPSLWGLLGDRFEDTGHTFDDGRHTRRGYELLPAELNRRVEELWGTAVVPRWPQALVTEPYPQASFAETLGVGIDFWHGVALTCWFICEGPDSRTDIGGMPDCYDRQINTLRWLGCPVDNDMFTDLREAEKKLTDRPPRVGTTTEHDLGNAMSFSITISTGPTEKDGFEHLRDIVTRYRRAWAEQHLEPYLHARWEQDLRGVGDAYHRHIADKGKPPTLRQFATLAEQAANHWFAGDLAHISNALGLQAPERQQYRRMLPADRGAFVTRVRDLLGGQRWEDSPDDMDPGERDRRLRLSELAEHAPHAIQIWEATGEPPPAKDLSWAKYRLGPAFGSDTEAGWRRYLHAVEAALVEPVGTMALTPPPVGGAPPALPAASSAQPTAPPTAPRADGAVPRLSQLGRRRPAVRAD